MFLAHVSLHLGLTGSFAAQEPPLSRVRRDRRTSPYTCPYMLDTPQAVILAAGRSTRMASRRSKLLQQLDGRALIHLVLDAVEAAGFSPVVVVPSSDHSVSAEIGERAVCVPQQQPLGSGDALRSVPEELRTQGVVLVVNGDLPLLRPGTIGQLCAERERAAASCALLTATLEEPSGWGRVVRDREGKVEKILEERDLEPAQTALKECNAGVYAFWGAALWPLLSRLTTRNAQGEYYLTELVELMYPRVTAILSDDLGEVQGVNDREQLALASQLLRHRTIRRLMQHGVTIEDPDTTFITSDVAVGPDTVIHPMTTLGRGVRVGVDCEIGPGARLQGMQVGDRVRIGGSVLEDSRIGDDVEIGEYVRIRPGTILASSVRVGTHAEIKNSSVGDRSRISHFCSVLDSDVGEDVNIGAGVVTCNYDGSTKFRTGIGAGAFIGSDAILVAPVNIGAGAYVAAGSVITADVSPGALAVARQRQHEVAGWVERQRAAAHSGRDGS